jgi:PPM family protein phosphatase
VDGATARRAPTEVPVVAGAASNGRGVPAPLMQRPDTPAGRANALTHTAPQPIMGGRGGALGPSGTVGPGGSVGPGGTAPQPIVDGAVGGPPGGPDTMDSANGRGGHAAGGSDNGETGRTRRRWPIVTTVLILLFAVIAGGGFAAWRYSQSQYYVAPDNGKVAIFRGINQKVAGLSLSSVYERTSIPLAAIPEVDRTRISAVIQASGLADARGIVTRVGNEVRSCQLAQAKLAAWETLVAHWPKPLKGQRPKPKPPRPTVPPDCPPATAGAAGGTTGTATSPPATPSARATP